MATEEHIDIVLVEMRAHYERLAALHDGMKMRTLALIAGEVAIVPFIFSSGFPAIQSVQEAIFFAIGGGLFAISFALLLWAISTADWQVPFGSVDSRKSGQLYPTAEKLKQYLKEDYEACCDACLLKIKARARAFNFALWILVPGLIILFVLKYT